jgi:hypothetical protein
MLGPRIYDVLKKSLYKLFTCILLLLVSFPEWLSRIT